MKQFITVYPTQKPTNEQYVNINKIITVFEQKIEIENESAICYYAYVDFAGHIMGVELKESDYKALRKLKYESDN